MSGDQLDLDAIEEIAEENSGAPMMVLPSTLLALVAEVRQLRAQVEQLEGDDGGTGPFVIAPPPAGPVEIQ